MSEKNRGRRTSINMQPSKSHAIELEETQLDGISGAGAFSSAEARSARNTGKLNQLDSIMDNLNDDL